MFNKHLELIEGLEEAVRTECGGLAARQKEKEGNLKGLAAPLFRMSLE